VKCAWWVIVQKHAPRPCGAHAVGARDSGAGVPVPSCKKHLRGHLPVVAVVADTIRRTLDGAEHLSLDSETDRAELLRLLVVALETPL